MRFLASVLAIAKLMSVPLAAHAQAVQVGILHSLTGALGISETTVVNAEKLAIEEINAKGGVLGRQIEYRVIDGESTPSVFATEAEKLCQNASIATVFGCWTSSSRKAVKPHFEKYKKLLWYPVQYEGQECSKYIFYSGAAPNQQIEPAVTWLLDNYPARKMFLVGSDYVFPRTANGIIKSMLSQLSAELIGERYVPLSDAANDANLEKYAQEMKDKMPDGGVIFNSLNGDSNVQLFKHMTNKGMTADKYPTMSVSITETEASVIGISKLIGHFASWNYFMTDPAAEPKTDAEVLSKQFITNYRARFGNTSLLNDPMEAAYINVYMWAMAAEKAQSFDTELVRKAAYGLTFDAPEGTVTLQKNHHLSKYVRIGKFKSDGLFEIVNQAENPVYPVPWNQFIDSTTGKTCDHSVEDGVDGTQFTPEAVDVGLMFLPDMQHVYYAQMLAIEEINTFYKGVNGKLILPKIITLNDAKADILSGVKSSAVAIFGTSMNSTVAKKWAEIDADIPSKPLVYTVSPGTKQVACSNRTLFFGMTIAQTLNNSLDWFENENFDTYVTIGSANDPDLADLTAYVGSKWADSNRVPRFKDIALTKSSYTSELASLFSNIGGQNKKRVAVINFLPGSDAKTAVLFQKLKTFADANPTYFVKAMSTAISEIDLTTDMTGHYAVASYMDSLSTPKNAVLLSSYRGSRGADAIVSNVMQEAYNAIYSWSEAVARAESTDPVKVRVNSYGVNQNTPNGLIRVEKNNMVTQSYRISQVISIGTKVSYRLTVGGDNLVDLRVTPLDGLKEGETCYFGENEVPTTNALGSVYFTVGSASLVILLSIALAGWVYFHREKVVVKHHGVDFLLVLIVGSMLSFASVYTFLPNDTTHTQCLVQYWPQHLGFYIVFGVLIGKCYMIQQNDRNPTLAKDIKPLRIVAGFAAFIVVLMAVRTGVETDTVSNEVRVIEEGISYTVASYCTIGIFQYIILATEVLVCILGCVFAVQIRNVETAFNEAFQIGSAIYLWAFIKVILELTLQFIPYDYELFFVLRSWGEIIPTVNTLLAFLLPTYKLISKGKGNEVPQSKQNRSASQSVQQSVQGNEAALKENAALKKENLKLLAQLNELKGQIVAADKPADNQV